jgi:hypothetical protein
MYLTRKHVEAMVDVTGQAINVNNGRCAVIEDALIQAGAVGIGTLDLLDACAALADALEAEATKLRRAAALEADELGMLGAAAGREVAAAALRNLLRPG